MIIVGKNLKGQETYIPHRMSDIEHESTKVPQTAPSPPERQINRYSLNCYQINRNHIKYTPVKMQCGGKLTFKVTMQKNNNHKNCCCQFVHYSFQSRRPRPLHEKAALHEAEFRFSKATARLVGFESKRVGGKQRQMNTKSSCKNRNCIFSSGTISDCFAE